MPLGASPGFAFADLFAVGLLFAGVVLFAAVAALSASGERAFSPAAVYLLIGALASAGLQLLGVGLLDPFDDVELIEHLTELAVIIALFGAGLRIDRRLGWRRWRSTTILIGLVMPLTIVAVAAFAGLFMGLSLGAAIVLAAAVSPTDPVLAREVQVGPPGEGDESEAHFALTSEAGLNDGLAFPFVFLGLLVAGGSGEWFAEWALADVLYATGVGVLIGALAGRGLGMLADRLRTRGLLDRQFDGWLALGAVLVIYGLTEVAGAYGFLAAFAGGLAFRRQEWEDDAHSRVHEGADLAENVGELALVLLLGSTVTLGGLGEPGLSGWLLVPFLLVLVRPLLVMACFARSDVPLRDRVYVGWFGIRGIGSFYYASVAIASGLLPAAEASVIYWTIIVVTGASIIVHGISATPLTRRFGLEVEREAEHLKDEAERAG